MSAVYRPMTISKIYFARTPALEKAIHIFFKPYHSTLRIFHAKFSIEGKYLYGSHILIFFYLEGNHTLCGENLYFIWKFSNGNTETGCYINKLVVVFNPDQTRSQDEKLLSDHLYEKSGTVKLPI